MKYIKTLFFLALICSHFFSSALAKDIEQVQWAKSVVNGGGSSELDAITIDSNGNLYAAGVMTKSNAYDFGNGVTANGTNSGDNSVLIKYDSAGNPQWARSVTSGDNDSHFYAVTTKGGNIYAAGYNKGTNIFSYGNGVSVNGASTLENAAIIKYNIGGVAQWAKSIVAGSSYTLFKSVAVDAAQNVYAVGYLSGSGNYDFGYGVIVSGPASFRNLVLVKYNSNGETQWAKSTIAAAGSTDFNSVDIGSNGDIYAAGYVGVKGVYDFGNGVTVDATQTSDKAAAIVKYNSNGEAQWAKYVASDNLPTNLSEFKSIAIDNNDNIYAAGTIGSKTFSFGNGVSIEGIGEYMTNIVLAKYDSSGNAQWAKSVSSGTDDSRFYSVVASDDGRIYASGYIVGVGSYDFGDGVTENGCAHNSANIVVVGYDFEGTPQWANSMVGATPPAGAVSLYNSVTSDNDKNVYTVGKIYSNYTYNLGNNTLVTGIAPTSSCFLIAKYLDNVNNNSSDSSSSNSNAATFKPKLMLMPFGVIVMMLL